MTMYWLIGQPRSIAELLIPPAIDSVPRERVPIVIIDDEGFPYLDLLRDHKYNMTKLDDITDVGAVESYPVVLCDIRGVGRSLSERFEGAHVISEVRKRYPNKVIVAYTAQQYDPTYNRYLDHADFNQKKDADSEEWIETLDRALQLATNPATAWMRIRSRLLEMDLPISTVMKLEDQYVKFVQQARPTFPDRKLSSHLPDQVKPLLASAQQTITLLRMLPDSPS